MSGTAVYALTFKGGKVGKIIADALGADLFINQRYADSFDAVPFSRLADVVRENFWNYTGHIFVSATGIVVRTVAPLLERKDMDPAVVVVDQGGRFCIGLVGGHLGGANALAEKVADMIGAKAVITTATDTEGLPSVDVFAKNKGMSIGNIEAVKHVNMAILHGEAVQLYDPEDRLGLQTSPLPGMKLRPVHDISRWTEDLPGIWVTWKKTIYRGKTLYLHPPCLVAGVGCNRGTSPEEIYLFIVRSFEERNLSLKSLKCLATIEAKRDEVGIKEAAARLGVDILYFDARMLEKIETPNPSDTVRKHMGVPGVCEAAAILGAGMGRLIVPKIKDQNTTLAVALLP